MNKRGQLTIFIIVAILIVAIVALFFVFRDRIFPKEEIQTNVDPLHTSILFCLEQTGKEGISYISSHGGYYNVPKEILFPYFTENFPYYYLNSKINVPSKERVEGELANYISENLYKCSDLESFRNQGFNITEGNISTSTTINEKNVAIKMIYPLSIKKGETVTRFSDFETKIDSQIGLLLNTSKEVTLSYSKKSGFVCLTCLEQISNKYNLNITATPLDNSPKRNIIWFTISEKEDTSPDKLKWIFIVEQ